MFASLSEACHQQLAGKGWHYYTFIGTGGAARFMCSWATTEAEVDALVVDVGSAAAANGGDGSHFRLGD